jgi:hypothetical protein
MHLLVLPRSHLTCAQLLHIPATNIHIPPILSHTVRETLDVVRTRPRRLVPTHTCIRVGAERIRVHAV